ncbi:hypothetical protein F5Y11DRAFT_148967 [Daldinia sp. FL1419]|nr:hypothetical protein F5Y11DRAFT_148967 [Daldinia sp. FL1419]
MANARPPCLVCGAAQSKYKCGLCNLYTCSLPCFREHRDNHPPVESPASKPKNNSSTGSDTGAKAQDASQNLSHTSETAANQSVSTGSGIADMPEYRELTKKYPHLERLLWNIAAATDPPQPKKDENRKPGALPNSNGGSNKGSRKAAQPWTKETGYEHGIELLRQARDNPGSDRDALREYCELVRLYNNRREAAEMDANFRQQIAQDNAKAIGELIRTEKADV